MVLRLFNFDLTVDKYCARQIEQKLKYLKTRYETFYSRFNGTILRRRNNMHHGYCWTTQTRYYYSLFESNIPSVVGLLLMQWHL